MEQRQQSGHQIGRFSGLKVAFGTALCKGVVRLRVLEHPQAIDVGARCRSRPLQRRAGFWQRTAAGVHTRSIHPISGSVLAGRRMHTQASTEAISLIETIFRSLPKPRKSGAPPILNPETQHACYRGAMRSTLPHHPTIMHNTRALVASRMTMGGKHGSHPTPSTHVRHALLPAVVAAAAGA